MTNPALENAIKKGGVAPDGGIGFISSSLFLNTLTIITQGI